MTEKKKGHVWKRVVAFLLLGFLFYLVPLNDLAAALSSLTVESIVILLLLGCVMIYVSALKWQLFLEALSAKVSVIRLFGFYLVGYFVNLVLPSYIGGDLMRSWYVGKEIGQHEALAATILERYTGLVAMLALGLMFVWFVGGVTWEIKAAVCVCAAGLAVITWLVLSPKMLERVSGIKQLKPVLGHFTKLQAGFILAKNNRVLLVKALGLSFLFHSLTVVNTIAAANAVGWDNPPALLLFIVLPLILLVGALPLAPSGLGIQEGAFFFFLTAIGATPAQALGVGLVLRAKGYVLAFFGWIVWSTMKPAEPVREPAVIGGDS